MYDEWNNLWSCVLGEKSNLNTIGKVVLFPVAFPLICFIFLLMFLFEKRQ